MRKIEFGSKFKKSFKKVRSYPKFKMSKYDEVIDHLVNGIKLPDVYNELLV